MNTINATKSGVTLANHGDLYCIPITDRGNFSCLGFDVCLDRIKAYAEYLGVEVPAVERGTLAAYEAFEAIQSQSYQKFRKTGEKLTQFLTPQLVGREGKRVEVVTHSGDKRRFWVGKSTGWAPVHLEISRRNSSGGQPVFDDSFASITVVDYR